MARPDVGAVVVGSPSGVPGEAVSSSYHVREAASRSRPCANSGDEQVTSRRLKRRSRIIDSAVAILDPAANAS